MVGPKASPRQDDGQEAQGQQASHPKALGPMPLPRDYRSEEHLVSECCTEQKLRKKDYFCKHSRGNRPALGQPHGLKGAVGIQAIFRLRVFFEWRH